MSQRDNSKKISIKWKLFAILLIFITVSVFVVWFFQVKMLYTFYRTTKFNELEISADKIIAASSDEVLLEDTVYNCAEENYSSIFLFKIHQNVASPTVTAIGSAGGLTPFFSKNDLQELYDNAVSRGGRYVATATHKIDPPDSNSKLEDISEYNGEFRLSRRDGISAVSAAVFSAGGNEYFLLQTSDLSPVEATVKTLNRQFLWIGVILVLLALILAELLHKLITKPIIQMNSSAQNLALGYYDVDFKGKGYREIYELSEALNYASRELSRSSKLQRELVSNVSHDLRTPLTMIKGYAEVMRDIPDENTPENVQVIIDETERLSDLVNDMLDMSKLQAGIRSANMQPFSLTQAIMDTLARYEKLTCREGYDIRFINDANEDVEVCADCVMILQVLYNLINNAINYTGEDKSVVVRQSIVGERVRVSVTDSGSGIDQAEIPFIWDRYYKVDKVHKRAMVGTGLGLSIVKEILELHASQFGVNSAVGHGSTFWFELDTVK